MKESKQVQMATSTLVGGSFLGIILLLAVNFGKALIVLMLIGCFGMCSYFLGDTIRSILEDRK